MIDKPFKLVIRLSYSQAIVLLKQLSEQLEKKTREPEDYGRDRE